MKIIKWEHVPSNHVQDDMLENDMSFDDDGDFLESEAAEHGMIKTVDFSQMSDQVDFTPWGPWHKDNYWGPYRMYDFWIAHLKGHSINDYPDFRQKLNDIEGVACWKIMDNYCFVMGMAKLYSVEEIVPKINHAFGVSSDSFELKRKLLDQIESICVDDEQYIGIVLPNGEIEISRDPESKEYFEIKNLVGQIPNSIVIENGSVIYE